jgi:hypothetical protein
MSSSRREFLATSGAASLAWVLGGRPGWAQERTADLLDRAFGNTIKAIEVRNGKGRATPGTD